MSPARPSVDLDALNAMSREAFLATIGPTFENAPWIAEAAVAVRPYASADDLHRAMLAAVTSAPVERQLAFLRGHPELAGREAQAGTMTDESTDEQNSAGLDALSRDELAQIQALNHAYRDRHGFPFIIAVRHHSKQQIFEALRSRAERSSEDERLTALGQIALITRGRLAALLGDPACPPERP